MRVYRFWGLAVMFLVGVWAKPVWAEYHGLFVPMKGAATEKYDTLLVYISDRADECDAFSLPEGGDGTVDVPLHAADLVYFYRARGTRLAGEYACPSFGETHARWFHSLNISVPGDTGAVPAQPQPGSARMAQVGEMQQDESGPKVLGCSGAQPWARSRGASDLLRSFG